VGDEERNELEDGLFMSRFFTAYGRNFDANVVRVALERNFDLTLRSQLHLSIIKNSVPTQQKTHAPHSVNAA
jgi:hypothetical protein